MISVLEYLFSGTIISSSKPTLVLKGGTALNLVYTNLPRLSVDIDLDYVGSIDKETALTEREEIVNHLDKYMEKDGYVLSKKTKENHILVSRIYSYINAYGNPDNIKIEINFIDRVHIGDVEPKTINYFNKDMESVAAPKDSGVYYAQIKALYFGVFIPFS